MSLSSPQLLIFKKPTGTYLELRFLSTPSNSVRFDQQVAVTRGKGTDIQLKRQTTLPQKPHFLRKAG